MTEEVKELLKKIKEKSLVINRIPKNIRDEFTKFAEEEFCNDYGMCLRDIWQDAKLFRKIKEMFIQNKLKLVFEK